MHAFSKELYDMMGVQVFILSCYLKPNGDLDVSTYDFNQELGNGKDYLDIHGRSFQEEGISVCSCRAHNQEYYGSEDLTGAKGGHQGSQVAIILEKNQYGEPVLPDPSKPPVLYTPTVCPTDSVGLSSDPAISNGPSGLSVGIPLESVGNDWILLDFQWTEAETSHIC
jgi:hypothetical protein